MKKHLLLFIVIASLSFNFEETFGQTTTSNPKQGEIEALLSHNWQITMLEINGNKMPPFKGTKGFMNFKTNKVLAMSLAGSSHNYNWSYDDANKVINLKNKEEKLTFKIVTISSKELIILDESEGYFEEGAPNLPRKTYLKRVD